MIESIEDIKIISPASLFEKRIIVSFIMCPVIVTLLILSIGLMIFAIPFFGLMIYLFYILIIEGQMIGNNIPTKIGSGIIIISLVGVYLILMTLSGIGLILMIISTIVTCLHLNQTNKK